jgi:ATP-dependent helicase/nuclease subunit A
LQNLFDEKNLPGSAPELGAEPQGFRLKTSILRAGAGAGKTTTLIRLFEEMALGFRAEHGRFPRIVLTTFTRKATQEIRERLLADALKKDLPELFRYINSRSRVHISTIHGVLSLYLTQYGKELGLAAEFKLMDAPEVYFREKRVLRHLLLENSEWLELVESFDISTLLGMLNSYYQHHFLHANAKPVSEEQLQTLAREILSEVAAKGIEFYHQIYSDQLSDSWRQYLQQFQILKSTESMSVEKLAAFFEGLGRKPPFSSKKPPFDEALHERFDRYVKDCKSLLQQEGFQASYNQRHQQLSDKFTSLAQAFCARNLEERLQGSVLSMSDLEGLALKMIRQAPWTAEKFAAGWDYWMIDEYQDTSPLQVELLNHLVGAAPHFVVGDPQQSIYLFRGARSDVFHAKVAQIRSLKGEVQTALTNYRSRAPLLEFINTYFSRKEAFASMVPHRQEGHGENCCDVVILDKISEKNDDQKETDKKAVLSLIQEKLAAGAQPQEICVLSRTNRILQEIAQLAFKYKIPVQLHSAGGFSSRREVQDFLAILKFLINPHDNYNMLAVLRSPWFHVPDPQILNLLPARRKMPSIWTHWNSAVPQVEVAILEKLNGYKIFSEKAGLSETLKRILTERGLIDSSLRMDPSGRREANLWKILVDYKAAEGEPGFNPLQFIENLNSSAEGQEDSDATPVIEPDRVNLMTIHASKGLQFKHVILAGFGGDQRKAQGDWWMIDEVTEQKKIVSLWGQKILKERHQKEAEESDRLLYVAMTRARDSLALIWTGSPRKGSWASEFPLSQSAGAHQYDSQAGGFCYQVRTQMPEPVMSEEVQGSHGEYREPFQKNSDLVASESVSAPVEGLRILLDHTRRRSDLRRFLEALRYQPELWSNPGDKYAETLSYLKSIREVPMDIIIATGQPEWHFVLRHGNQCLDGHIDLWSRIGEEVWLVDYKTGALKDWKKTLSRLERQAWALREMDLISGSDRIHLVALYINEKEFRLKSISATDLVSP